MRHRSLDAWLDWLEALHPKKIDLGLERVRDVASRLDLLSPEFPIITVAGTNGKGSTVALLRSILAAAGYRVGSFTSPHLARYNERIVIAGSEAGDADIMRAFVAIDKARAELSLSYFEVGALAAMWLFHEAAVDLVVLEVGLGGRLDAVNIWDADVAVLTSVGIDHTEWLGDTREQIALEKAAIARSGRILVCGDREPPETIERYLRDIDCDYLRLAQDFDFAQVDEGWVLKLQGHELGPFPMPALRGSHQLINAATAITALSWLMARLEVPETAIKEGLKHVSLSGRYETIEHDGISIVLDVAHNPHGALRLAQTLKEDSCDFERTVAIVGMLEGKQSSEFISCLVSQVDSWVLCAPDYYRALPAVALASKMKDILPDSLVTVAGTAAEAFSVAQGIVGKGDRLLVTGSFYTVAELRQKLL